MRVIRQNRAENALSLARPAAIEVAAGRLALG